MVSLVTPVAFVVSLLGLAVLLFEVAMLVDAAIRPAVVWQASVRQPKAVWVAILAAAVLTHVLFGAFGMLGLAGLVAALVYAVDTRRRLREATPPRAPRARRPPRGGIGPTPWS